MSRESVNKINLIFMRKLKMFAVAFVAAVMLSGCALTLPVNATGLTIGEKVGTAKATGYFGSLFFNADASIQSAAKNGGITRISTVDLKVTSLLGIIVTFETIVTGQ